MIGRDRPQRHVRDAAPKGTKRRPENLRTVPRIADTSVHGGLVSAVNDDYETIQKETQKDQLDLVNPIVKLFY